MNTKILTQGRKGAKIFPVLASWRLGVAILLFTILNSPFPVQSQPSRELGFFMARSSAATSGCGPAYTTQLAAWWTMDDTSGADSSGNGNTATLVGYNSQAAPTLTGGEITNALLFSDNQGLTFSRLGTSAYYLTVTMWIYPTAVGPNGNPYDMLIADSVAGLYLYLASGSGAPYKLGLNGNLSAGTLTLNAWHFIAVTWSYSAGNEAVTFYIDGNPADANSPTVASVPAFNCMGVYNGADNFSGRIDDARVYNRVLSDTHANPEIWNQYQWPTGGRPGTPP
jgi:hypothetical protein